MDKDFDRKFDYYNAKREEMSLTSVWSIYEIEDLESEHPFGEGVEVVYAKDQNHWGNRTVSIPVAGKTWSDLYVAADGCIRGSGDNHHIYIEQFIPSSTNPKILFLHTGS